MCARLMGDNVNFSWNSVALETSLNSAVINFTNAAGDITSFADPYMTELASGKKNTTLEISGSLDMGASGSDQTLFEGVGTGVKTTVFDPVGTGPAAGAPEYTCTASGLTGSYIAAYNIDLPVGGPGTYSATIQNSGSTTRAVS
jgi:hypothetical protein